MKPHCYGKMTWILKYPEDEVPNTSICSCVHRNSCLRITQNNADKLAEGEGENETGD